MKKAEKTFFIVPGFRMQVRDKDFRWLVDFLGHKNFRVIGVPVRWQRRTLTQQAAEFVEFFHANKGSENYVLGFSLGGAITFMTAEILKPRRIAICSIGPEYAEDYAGTIPAHVRFMGKRRYEDMKTRSARAIARGLSVPCAVVYGSAEAAQFPILKSRVEEVATLAKHARVFVAKDAGHQFDAPGYIDAVKRAVADW